MAMNVPVSNQAARVRVSQRQPQACRECTKRKRKCDKQIPCSRCKRLNMQCSIEVVQLRRNAVQYGSEIQFLNSLVADLESSPSDPVPLVVQKIKNRVFRLQTGQDPAESDVSNTASAQPESSTTGDRAPGKAPLGLTDSTSNQIDSSLLTAIEHLAWGRNSAGCFPHRTCSCQYRKDGLQSLSGTSPSLLHGPNLELNSAFPSSRDAQKLVKFHLCHLAWHHNCIHGPTFLEQCELFWETGKFDDPLWQALYFSVLSSTVSSIQDSVKVKELVDVNLQAIQSTQQLFSAMVQTLYNSHFLSNLSVYSVQAIVISTEVAHNLGLSQLNATLFNAAVRIAECLGIHKIQDQSKKLLRSKDEWDENVEREVGKRVWCQMIIQDHFAIPFTDTYSISPMHFSTGRPMNADDHDLTDMPITSPTISTYIRVLVNLAELMPGLVDGLGPMKSRKPLRQQYEHILHIDQKMRGIVKNIPPFFLRGDKTKEAQIPWLAIARRSLAITAAEKIIMIHRPFLFRSFSDPTYTYSRRTCVAAAMTILREHEVIVREGDISIWTHTAFAITAAVIMCFEVKATAENQANIAQSHKDAIVAARTRLADRTNDVLAQRGVALIDAIFTADTASGSAGLGNGMIDFGQILAKFSTFTRINLGPNTPDTSVSRFSNSDPQDVIGAHFNEMQPAWDTAEDIDFDAWFNGTFHTLHDPLRF
ncbi:Monooxygenase FAD-binding [Penicillium cf. griseofulvum]|nr:Monooxygenase FAD-binding [Penicillium cf. griseofulvum]